MGDGFTLTESNAPRTCKCGDEATAYLHETGFRCSECDDRAPEERAVTAGGETL